MVSYKWGPRFCKNLVKYLCLSAFLRDCMVQHLGRVITGPSDARGSCVAGSYSHKKEGEFERCCCGKGCCWDKCDWEEPPRNCLPPMTQWKQNDKLGYFQAVQIGEEIWGNPIFMQIPKGAISNKTYKCKRLIEHSFQIARRPNSTFHTRVLT